MELLQMLKWVLRGTTRTRAATTLFHRVANRPALAPVGIENKQQRTHGIPDHSTGTCATLFIVLAVRGLVETKALPPTDEGAGVISARRRQSNSFKTLTKGGLVSNSPFARLGQVHSPPLPQQPIPSLYSTARSPARPIPSTSSSSSSSSSSSASSAPTSALGETARKTSGGSRRSSIDLENQRQAGEEPVNAPAGPASEVTKKPSYTPIVLAARPQGSPSVPFRPVRSQPSLNSLAQGGPARLLPPRPSQDQQQQQQEEPLRRTSSSFAAVKRNGLVSSSPFNNNSQPPAAFQSGRPLSTIEGTPLHGYPLEESDRSDDDQDITPSASPALATAPSPAAKPFVGLGLRPGAPPTPERRVIAGTSAPPPATPPQERARSSSGATSPAPSPSSALSQSRRGIRGPRAPVDLDAGADETEGEEEEDRRVLRRQASTKTVTWAETEEVLEFEVDRRSSVASSMLSEGEGERSFDSTGSDDPSFGFEEGGSVEVHSLDDGGGDSSADEDDNASAVSNQSGVDDLVDTIDSFMLEEDQLRIDERDDSFGEERVQYGGRRAPPAPQSAFSTSTVEGDQQEEEQQNSDSSYDDDEELHQAAKAHSALDQVELTFDLASPPTSPAPPTPRPAQTQSLGLTAYSLPDVPQTSPFLGFADDGGASSVVSMDLTPRAPRTAHSSSSSVIPTTEPLQSPRIPTTSTPTRNSIQLTAPDLSPILSAFIQDSPELPLSREASLVGSDYRASLRGGSGKLAANREAFEEKLRRQQAILESFDPAPSSSRAATVGSATGSGSGTPKSTTTSPVEPDVFLSPNLASFPNPPLLQPVSRPPSSKAIPARAALRNTASNSNLRVEPVPATSLSSIQYGMESPLERLGREVLPTTNSSVSLASMGSGLSATELREAQIIERKRSLKKEGRGRPRRSLSTGDARPLMRVASIPMKKQVTMPELGMLTTGLEPIADSFASGVESDLDYVFQQRHTSYRIRESKIVVYANDGEVATVGVAGDVDPGRAWRKKRPSDMNMPQLQSMRSISTAKSHSKPAGQTFIRILEFQFENNAFPGPVAPTTVECFVRQDPQPSVKVGSFPLGLQIPIEKEFELSKTSPLEICLTIPIDASRNCHLLPPASPSAPPKSPSRFRAIFSSPTKPKRASTPVLPRAPDRIYEYIANDHTFARTSFPVASQAPNCRGRVQRFAVPIETDGKASRYAAAGVVVLEVLWIPPLGSVAVLPKSMSDVKVGLAAAEAETTVLLETILTQLGGDCVTWRRRLFKLVGHRLIPYSEVTKKAMVEIDLSLADSVYDPQNPAASPPTPLSPATAMTRTSSLDLEEERWTAHEHSFLVSFKDGSEIEFFADRAEDKERWIALLTAVIGRKARKAAPEWALRFKKLGVASAPAATTTPTTSAAPTGLGLGVPTA
ncbi:hypothetical protein RQP46_004710 [Phenoliferia psychrophenolica]